MIWVNIAPDMSHSPVVTDFVECREHFTDGLDRLVEKARKQPISAEDKL